MAGCLQEVVTASQRGELKKYSLTDSLLIRLSRVVHHLYKIPVASASTPTTDQLEPAPELSYPAVYILIKLRGMLL